VKQKKPAVKTKLLYLSLITLLFCSGASAQVLYGLKDCIGIGLERNFSILVARNSETISKNNYTVGNAGYLPTVTVGSNYYGVTTNSIMNNNDGTKDKSNGIVSNSASASAILAMNIFSGFNVRTTYKKLNELNQLGELNTQITIENYISSVVSTYYLYVQEIQTNRNLAYALTLSRERLRIDEERYLLGSNSKLQVLQSRVYVNSDSSNLATQIQVLRETQIRLNELMAVEDVGTRFSLKDTSITVDNALIYEKLLEETLVSNTSLRIATKNRIVSEYDYKLAVSRTYPFLDLNGGYNYNFSTNSSATYKNLAISGPSVGLTFGINVFDGFNLRRQIRNSALEIKNRELRYSEIEQGVRADLLSIYSGYTNNLNLINLEEQNLATAAENLSIAMERYKLGNLSGLDLREVQKSLLDAKERLLSVQYLAKLAEISLLQISGKIMTYFE
jgi:adhesin transport system outer membrane protein